MKGPVTIHLVKEDSARWSLCGEFAPASGWLIEDGRVFVGTATRHTDVSIPLGQLDSAEIGGRPVAPCPDCVIQSAT